MPGHEIKTVTQEEWKKMWNAGELCKSNQDGDCNSIDCPQLRDNEPAKTGRWCPLIVNCEEF